MSLRSIAALSFVSELEKIGSDLGLPLSGVTVKEAEAVIKDSFLEPLLKVALTRSVKEWRAANAAGNTGQADAIAQGAGQLGLKPRQLKDVSIGGAEAGVDQMMGHAGHVQPGGMPQADPIAPRRALDQRVEQMKANKAQLGLQGRMPAPDVKASPEGRAALLRGTQPAAPAAGPAPNESGYIARKMYKPDSYISQAEFTPQHLAQKMEMTQAARGLGPEAKAMVPDMYGHTTMGQGPKQRSMSYHEFVPGMQDLRGKNTGTEDKPIYSGRQRAGKDLTAVDEKVLKPLQAKGMTMADVTGVNAEGEHSTNWGNVQRDAKGQAKVVDFLPAIKGQPIAASKSFAKYAPMPTMRHSEAGGGTVADLRKEMFKPTMESRPASPEQLRMALRAHGQEVPEHLRTPAPAPGGEHTGLTGPQIPRGPSPVNPAGATVARQGMSTTATSAAPLPVTRPVTPGALRPPPAASAGMLTKPAVPGSLRKPLTSALGALHR